MTTTNKRFAMPRMEGRLARWYAVQRRSGNQPATYRRQAAALTAGLPADASVLEVAPGPGYQAIEIARLGYRVTGLDISHTFVGIATDNAGRPGWPSTSGTATPSGCRSTPRRST